jgi:hypothetical protein
MARPVCLLCWEYPDFVRKPTCKNGRPPKATNAAVRPGTARTRGGPRPRPRVDARALRAGGRRCNPRFRGVMRLAGVSAARDGGCVLDRDRAAPSIQAVQAGGGGGHGRSSTLAGSRTRSPQSRVWGASAADAPRHRRCGLPKIARMPTLASPNRVLHRGTPVKPSPGRAIAGWHVPAGLTITDVSRCFARNRTTC